MDVSEESERKVFDGSGKNANHSSFGLPLAAIFCIAIILYGLAVIICMFMRQVILNRRPLDTLESLHCCDCLMLWPRPTTIFNFPCVQASKADHLPWRLHLESLWARLPSVGCRRPDTSRARCCCPLRAACPSSVRCCGLEIRRTAEPAKPCMVDASVSSGDVLDRAQLRSPTLDMALSVAGSAAAARLDSPADRCAGDGPPPPPAARCHDLSSLSA